MPAKYLYDRQERKKNLYRNNSSLTSELEAAHIAAQLSLEGFESGMMLVGFSNRKTRQCCWSFHLYGLIKKRDENDRLPP